MLIDVHCHANLYVIIEEIIKDAKDVGVDKIISVGMSLTSLKRVIEISNSFDSIYPSLGIHPEEVENNSNIVEQLDSAIEFIRKNGDNLCGIGEIGLDHHFVKNKELYPLQRLIFEKMLSLAQELKLPVNLHTKGAEKEVFELLPSYNLPNINIHWYSGPETYLKTGIDRGYYFSITPAIKYSPAVKKTVMMIDEDHLLLESDGPVEYTGVVGTPAMIKDVLISISSIKSTPIDELERTICENTKKVFSNIFL